MASSAWGRNRTATRILGILAFGMLIGPPLLVSYFIYACDNYQCAIVEPAIDMYNNGFAKVHVWLQQEFWQKLSWAPFALVFGWVAFHAILEVAVPAIVATGEITPDGRVPRYRVHALRCYMITCAVYLLGVVVFGRDWASAFYKYRLPVFFCTNLYGFLACGIPTVIAHIQGERKGIDRVFSGSFAYDFFMGVDLHPRLGKMFDLKLFHNGHVGMISWPIVNLSYLFEQYYSLGYVTPGMWASVFLQSMYITDFYWMEDWYLKTIDIALDHYGYYLIWGITNWVPFMYTLQARYIMTVPSAEANSVVYAAVCVAVGMAGFSAFRLCNNQRNLFRNCGGECTIYGKRAEYVLASYQTADGRTHNSKLLVTGPWGWARHFNYAGDLLLSLSYCLPAGFHHVMPYFYAIFMTILLVHRVSRDDLKCRNKYGAKWDEYCARVPYKIFPGIY